MWSTEALIGCGHANPGSTGRRHGTPSPLGLPLPSRGRYAGARLVAPLGHRRLPRSAFACCDVHIPVAALWRRAQ